MWHGTEEVAEDVWDWTKDEGVRFGDAGVTLFHDVVEGGKAVLSDFNEGMAHVGRGLVRIGTGDVAGGGAELGKGLAQATVGGVVDAGAMILAGGISAVQVIGHIEPVARPLTQPEIDLLRPIYGNSIDYSAVRIKEGGSGLLNVPNHSRTVGNTIYMSRDHSDPRFNRTLVHEMAHVWQFQNGGADYLSKSLAAQAFGSAYEGKKAALEETPWEAMSPEDQADLLALFFESNFPGSGKFTVTDKNGMMVDRTAYANKVLEQVQRGLGATG